MKFESCADSPFSIRAMVRVESPPSVATSDCVSPSEMRRRASRSPISVRTVASVSEFSIFINSLFWLIERIYYYNKTILTI